MSVFPFYFSVFAFPLVACVGIVLGGWATYSTVVMAFVLLPLLDILIGNDHRNLSEEEYKILEHQKSFRIMTVLYAFTQAVLTLWGAWHITHSNLTLIENIGIIFSIGIVNGGLGITIAHELVHKPTRIEQFCGKMLLLLTWYMHFAIEHVAGHHVRVGTKEDPATARYGESLYAFLPRTIIGGFISAWQISARKQERKKMSVWSWQNPMIQYQVLPILFAVVLGVAFGWQAVVYFAGESVVAILLLEIVNYLEHYGLERQTLENGRLENVSEIHSWETRALLSNYVLLRLQRHSDHHIHPLRRYQTLRAHDESPQLPAGYPAMMLLSTIPPLWRKVMHPRIKALHERISI
jgi:alkane 1-monooxygenase